MNWLSRYKVTAAISVLAAGAIAAGVLWPTSQDNDPARPVLVRVDQTSVTYLNRHAQGWLACPAAANTCYGWRFSEVASPLIDAMSGTSAQLAAAGTPTYRVHTPIPTTTGFDRRAVAFDGTSAYFDAAAVAVGDVTTNNFTIKGWLCPQSVTSGYIVSKINGGNGYDLYFNAGALTLRLTDAGGTVAGSVGTWPVVAAANLVGCRVFQVRVDRAGNATADFDGVNSGVNLNVAARNLTLTNAINLRVGRSAAAGATYYTGNIGEIVVANGLGTLAEQVTSYKAFKVPTSASVPGIVGTPTYSQTTTRKWPLPPEAGFGERLGVYAGSATNPQWPVAYDATRVSTTKNPLGTLFPTSGATVNSIGYTNEFNSWTMGSVDAAVVANSAEAPDGSMTADTLTVGAAGTGYITKTTATGGVVVAGERWCASTKIRKIGGAATYACIRPSGAGDGSATLLNTFWQSIAHCGGSVGAAKNITIWFGTSTADCLVASLGFRAGIAALADAQHEANNVTPPCTSTTGNVSQTCNASYLTLNWSAKSTLMPQSLERFEVVYRGTSEPFTSAPGTPQTKWMLGNNAAYLSEGVNTALVVNNQGGYPEYVSKYRGIGSAVEARDYVASWDLRNGLTNTSPRRYGGLAVDRNGVRQGYTPFNLESRKVDATIDAATPANQRDLNSTYAYVGCRNGTGSPTQCSQGGVELFEVWGRPAQDVKANDSTSILNADFTGASYLQAQSIPRFSIPTGALAANTWIWDMGEYSGSLYDRINGVALAPTGTPRYGAWSGLVARGQGRRGVSFVGLNAVSGPTGGAIAGDTFTVTQIFTLAPVGGIHDGFGNCDGTGACTGWMIRNLATGYIDCYIYANGAASYNRSAATVVNGTHVITCVFSRPNAAANWSVPVQYIDGVVSGGGGTALANGNMVNNNLYIGNVDGHGFAGSFQEAFITTSAWSAAEALARYKQTTQQGTYWTDDANTLAHYKFNETTITNGVGIRDHSGNGNHLTVVAGTPTPQYADMPWPAGSGTYKPNIHMDGGVFTSAGAWPAPQDNQPFSYMYWIRGAAFASDYYVLGAFNAADNDTWLGYVSSTGIPTCLWKVDGTTRYCPNGPDIRDGIWHLIAVKAVKAAGVWTPYLSVDGAAFVAGGLTVAGDPSGNVRQLTVGRNIGLPTTVVNLSGVELLQNYELTNADVLSYYKAGTSPLSTLTYTRTNKACYETGIHPVDGMQVRCWGAGQVPFGFENALGTSMGNDRTGWGIPVHLAVVDQANYSERLDFWTTPSQLTVAVNQIPSPSDTTTAEKLTQTVANSTHYVEMDLAGTTGYKVPQNEFVVARGYLKAGANVTWSALYVGSVAGADYAYAPVNLTTAVVGTPGVAGASWTTAAATVLGVANGWIRVLLTAKCVVVGGCPLFHGICSSNADGACGSFVGAVANYSYGWGVTVKNTGAGAGSDYGVYCPSLSDAATTCNASTLSVAAANLASWTRAQGQVSWLGYSRNTLSYGYDLYNASNAGRHYLLSQGTEGWIYDSVGAGALQNRWSLANAQVNTVTGVIQSWDSSGVYYTDQAGVAQTAYGRSMQSNYAGPWPTYTTRSNGWVPVAGTNLYMGADNAGANGLNGLIVNQSIHSTR